MQTRHRRCSGHRGRCQKTFRALLKWQTNHPGVDPAFKHTCICPVILKGIKWLRRQERQETKYKMMSIGSNPQSCRTPWLKLVDSSFFKKNCPSLSYLVSSYSTVNKNLLSTGQKMTFLYQRYRWASLCFPYLVVFLVWETSWVQVIFPVRLGEQNTGVAYFFSSSDRLMVARLLADFPSCRLFDKEINVTEPSDWASAIHRWELKAKTM